MKFNHLLCFYVLYKLLLHPRYGITAYSVRLLVMVDFLLDTRYPNFALFIQGDFQWDHNNCKLRNQLIHYRQLVSCCTRENKTLDHFYTRIKGAFCALSLATSTSPTVWTPTLTQYAPTSPSVRKSVYLRRPLWAMVTPVLDFQRNCGIKKKITGLQK